MFWKEINSTHHGKKASVGPHVGTIICRHDGDIPILDCDNLLRFFAWYWAVEILEE